MAGVTDLPFRRLCRSMGAGIVVGEMVSCDPSLRNSRKSRLRTRHDSEPSPRVVQIVGGDAQMLAQSAAYNVSQGAQIIDINMGCPAKKVCNKAAGSALLKDPLLVEQILNQVVAAVDVPVTLKIRTGWDEQNKNAVEIAKIAEQAGIQLLSVHGRTRACKFAGNAEYRTIKQVKDAVSIPVIANGDIDSPQKARQVLDMTGVDGLMIGRAAQGRPWIFQEIDYYLTTGKFLAAKPVEQIEQILTSHVESLHNFYGEIQGAKIARKHFAWYLTANRLTQQSFTEGQFIKDQVVTNQHADQQSARTTLKIFNQITSAKKQLAFLAVYFNQLKTEKAQVA